MTAPARIACFAARPFHAPILEPVRHALADHADARLFLDRREAVAFAPHVLVLACHTHLEYFRQRLSGTPVVNVRHGLVSKDVVGRLPRRESTRWFDYVCVGPEARIDSYERAGVGPREYWVTGYPQLDPLWRGDPPPMLPLPAGRPTVLYAPTWDLGLSSAPVLGDRLVDLIREHVGRVNVLIKPHPVIGDWRPEWMRRWARLAATLPGVHLVTDTHADLMPYLQAADLLVSDASSAIFAFLALDRPIVLVTNPRHTADPGYDARDIIWRWRDIGEEVCDPERLGDAVARGLADPAHRRDRRQRYARELFGDLTDGRAYQRIADRVLATAAALEAGAGPPPLPLERVGRWRAGWYDLRRRLGSSPALRRLVFHRLEEIRLAARERSLARAPQP